MTPAHENDSDVLAIAAAMACAAERDADPAATFWDGYFERSSEARGRMEHMDEYMRGRMLASVYDLLMIDEPAQEHSFLAFEIGNHAAYGANLPMYEALFDALEEALRECCAEAWEDAWGRAFRRRARHLLGAIEDFAVATPALS